MSSWHVLYQTYPDRKLFFFNCRVKIEDANMCKIEESSITNSIFNSITDSLIKCQPSVKVELGVAKTNILSAEYLLNCNFH